MATNTIPVDHTSVGCALYSFLQSTSGATYGALQKKIIKLNSN